MRIWAWPSPNPPFQLVCPTAPVYSRARYLPPSLFEGARIRGSLIADGCRIGKGAVIENSIIGLRCIIGENVTIRNSIIMGADYYEQADAARPCGPESSRRRELAGAA